MIENRGFKSAEAEIERMILDIRFREPDRFGIAGFGRFFDERAAGKTESEQFAHLVERLSGRIIAGSAEDRIIPPVFHVNKLGVPAGDDEHEKRRR